MELKWQDNLKNMLLDTGLHSTEFAKVCMVFDSLKNGKTHVRDYSHDGILKEDFKKVCNSLCEITKSRVVYSSFELTNEPEVDDSGYRTNNYSSCFIGNEDTLMKLTLTMETHHLTISAVTLDGAVVSKIHEYVDPILKPETSDGRVYVFSSSPGESLMSMGVASIPFESSNYSEQVVEDYERAVNDLNSLSPSGRLVIIGGPPGTGKTFMIRALLNDVPDAMFIMLPSDMVSAVMNPQMMTTLIKKKKSGKMALVFIIEDADAVLVKRAGDNMNSISALLNMSSGIVGSMLDVRVVATTNASRVQFDEAITRSGRLSVQIDVGELSMDRAKGILKRLFKGSEYDEKFTKFKSEFEDFFRRKNVILADVYDFARSVGWSDVKSEAGKVVKRKAGRRSGYSPGGIGF